MSFSMEYTKSWELFEQEIQRVDQSLKQEEANKDKKGKNEAYQALLLQAKKMIEFAKTIESCADHEERGDKYAELRILEAVFLPSPIKNLKINSRATYKLFAAYQSHLQNFARVISKDPAFNNVLFDDRVHRAGLAEELWNKIRDYREKHKHSPLSTPDNIARNAKKDVQNSNNKGLFGSFFATAMGGLLSSQVSEKNDHAIECEEFNQDYQNAHENLTNLLANDGWCSHLILSTKTALEQFGVHVPKLPILQTLKQESSAVSAQILQVLEMEPGSVAAQNGKKMTIQSNANIRKEREKSILSLSRVRLDLKGVLLSKERELNNNTLTHKMALFAERQAIEKKKNAELQGLFNTLFTEAKNDAERDARLAEQDIRNVELGQKAQEKLNLQQEIIKLWKERNDLEKEKAIRLAAFRDRRKVKDAKVDQEEQNYVAGVLQRDGNLSLSLTRLENQLKTFDSCETSRELISLMRKRADLYKEKEKRLQQILLPEPNVTSAIMAENEKKLAVEFAAREAGLEKEINDWQSKLNTKLIDNNAKLADHKASSELKASVELKASAELKTSLDKILQANSSKALVNPKSEMQGQNPLLNSNSQGIVVAKPQILNFKPLEMSFKYQTINAKYQNIEAEYQSRLQSLQHQEIELAKLEKNAQIFAQLSDFFDKLLMFKQQSLAITWDYSDKAKQQLFKDALVEVNAAIVGTLQRFQEINYADFSMLIEPALTVIRDKYESYNAAFDEYNRYYIANDFEEFCESLRLSPLLSGRSSQDREEEARNDFSRALQVDEEHVSKLSQRGSNLRYSSSDLEEQVPVESKGKSERMAFSSGALKLEQGFIHSQTNVSRPKSSSDPSTPKQPSNVFESLTSPKTPATPSEIRDELSLRPAGRSKANSN